MSENKYAKTFISLIERLKDEMGDSFVGAMCETFGCTCNGIDCRECPFENDFRLDTLMAEFKGLLSDE